MHHRRVWLEIKKKINRVRVRGGTSYKTPVRWFNFKEINGVSICLCMVYVRNIQVL